MMLDGAASLAGTAAAARAGRRPRAAHAPDEPPHERRGPPPPPRARAATRDRVLGDIHSELRELTDVTNELVALAAEEADDERTQVVDVAALAPRCAARTERRRHRPVVVDAAPWSVRGKPRQLLRVLDNVLDNAAKFDRSTEQIEVIVRPGTISVRDHGAGIEPTDLVRVFDRFYRAPEDRAQPGSGLGLAIASDVVHRHGGTISAANHPERRGAHHHLAAGHGPGIAWPTDRTAGHGGRWAPPMSHQTLT